MGTSTSHEEKVGSSSDNLSIDSTASGSGNKTFEEITAPMDSLSNETTEFLQLSSPGFTGELEYIAITMASSSNLGFLSIIFIYLII